MPVSVDYMPPSIKMCIRDSDWRVPMQHSVDLYHKMKDLGKDVELKLYEGEDHETAIGGHMGTYLKWLLEH